MSTLAPEQLIALKRIVEDRESIAVEGGPGTGKSFIIKKASKLLEKQTKLPVLKLALTNSAALLIKNGVGLWAFLGCCPVFNEIASEWVTEPPIPFLMQTIRASLYNAYGQLKYCALFIDEGYMMPYPHFALIDGLFRALTRTYKPFGGLQTCVFGDPGQLAPVAPDFEGGVKLTCNPFEIKPPYLFHSPNFISMYKQHDTAATIVLTHNFRSSECPLLCEIIDYLAINDIKDRPDLLEHLQTRIVSVPRSDAIILCGLIRTQISWNKLRLDAAPGEMHTYVARLYRLPPKVDKRRAADHVAASHEIWPKYAQEGDFDVASMKEFKVMCTLELKEGSPIIFTQPVKALGIVKCDRGRIGRCGISTLDVYVERLDKTVRVMREDFVRHELGGGRVLVRQFPCTLAYAMNIHQMQGREMKPTEFGHIILSELWEPGHARTGFSRFRRLLQFTLDSADPRNIITDPALRVHRMSIATYRPGQC